MDSPLDAICDDSARGKGRGRGRGRKRQVDEDRPLTAEETAELVAKLEKEMRQCAKDLEFERAAELRDRIRELREKLIALPE
jgi:excinuclease ABC subunit B